MRTIAVMVGLMVTTASWGQAPPATPPSENPQQQRLDLVLKYWEQAMSQVTSLEADCERTTEDKVYKTKEVYRGTARYLKGNGGPGLTSRASLYLVKTDNKEIFERFILSGPYFYEIAPATKEIRVHTLPEPKLGENTDHNLVGLLFGMKAAQAKERYKIELEKEDQHYFYLRVETKRPEDRAEFDKAQLALIRATYMPRQLHFLHPNGNRVTWDLPRVQQPANHLTPAMFEAPAVPAGWKMNRVPSTPLAPSKVRSAGE